MLLPQFAARQVQKDMMQVGGLEFEVFDADARASQAFHPSGEFVSEIFTGSDDPTGGGLEGQARRKLTDGPFDIQRHALFFAHGLFQELFDAALRDDLAMIDNHDPVASLLGFVQMMGCKQDGCPQTVQFIEHIEDPLTALGIDTDGGFIEQQKSGLVHHSASDVDASFHPPGKFRRQIAGSILESDPVQGPVDAIVEFAPPQAVQSSKAFEVFTGR